MQEYDNQPTIITLSPNKNSDNTIQAVSFEEAFGEHSNLFGKGRARRAARKARRQQKRVTRVQARGAKKAARRANKLAKVQDRTLRKQTRVEGRVARKMTRKQGRIDKRAIGQDPQDQGEYQDPDLYQDDTQTGTDSVSDTSYDSAPQGSGDAGYSSEDDNGMADVGPELNPDGEGEEYAEEGYDDEEAGYEGEEGGEEESEFEGEDSGFDGDDSGFDGDDSAFDGNDDSQFLGEEANSEFANENAAQKPINPKVKKLAQAIEVQGYIIHCLTNRLGKGGNDEAINERLAEHKTKLQNLMNAVQSYSEARGGGRHAAARQAKREVHQARKAARKDLHAQVKAQKQANRAAVKTQRMSNRAAIKSMRVAGKAGLPTMPGATPGTVPVAADLDPTISQNSIEIPASEVAASSFNGTGLIALDDERDYDAPETRAVDIKSNFNGSNVKTWPWGKILIGAAIIGVAVVYLKKKKVI